MSKELNKKILKAFKMVRKVEIDYGDTSCKTPDVPKILSNEKYTEQLV